MESRQLLTVYAVTNTNDAGPGSFRQAILDANDRPGGDSIDFDILASTSTNLDVPVPGFDPVTQTWRITLASALPAISDQVTIDGYSQAHSPVSYRYPEQVAATPLGDPILITSKSSTVAAKDGDNAVLRVILDGSQTGGAAGIDLRASHSIVRGLIIDGFGVGVSLPDPGVVGDRIQGNDVGQYFVYPVDSGTGAALPGSAGQAFVGRGNSLQGVLVAAKNATIGGTGTQDANLIVGNGLQGIQISPGATGNQVYGNQIGIAGPSVGNLFVIAPNGREGVLVASSSNQIGGPDPGAGNLISGNGSHGVWILGAEATRNNVEGNYIGVGPGGGFRFGASHPGNFGDGVRIQDACDNDVGGTAAAQLNVISANDGAGVRIFGTAARDVVRGNYIGLTSDGLAALGNGLEGVAIYSSGNIVGPGNVISTNLRGVLLSGPGASGNVIQDDRIGTDVTGGVDLGNALEGIRIDEAPGNRVTGDSTGSQVISGNTIGIAISGNGATGNVVLGSLIGTDATGKLDLGNSQEGIRVDEAPRNTIGGAVSSSRNLISANHWGVVISGVGASGNVLQGNFIGTDITGISPLGNGNELDGVFINGGASGNLVGGPTVAAGNTIAFNRRDGVRVEDSSIRNAILTNSIFANFTLGIDLVVPAIAGVLGPNRLLNAPALLSVATSTSSTIIRGSLASTPNTVFTIQFFGSSPLDPTAQGEGALFLGQVQATTGADGTANYSANVPTLLTSGQFVTATATDPAGNTSEFSGTRNEMFGTVLFQMASYVVTEGVGTATIVATRSGGSGGRFTVNYATAGGSGVAGSDYLPTSGTLTFNPGEDSESFPITVIDDGLADADRTVDLILSNPVGAVTLGPQSAAVLTILGNQPGALQFSMGTFLVGEDAGSTIVTVSRSSGAGTVSVNYATADGSATAGVNYLPASGTLTFSPGETVKTFTIPILVNPLIQGNSTVLLNLSSPAGGATLGTPSTAVLVIVDDGRDRIGPLVTSVGATSGTLGVASVVIHFSEFLDPARATNLLNYGYSVRTAGRDGKLGTGDDHLIGLGPAVYDPATLSVTLPLATAIAANTRLEFMINQATDVPGANVGVSDLAGNLLDGNSDGQPGGVFTSIATARPAPAVTHKAASKPKSPAARPVKHPAPPRAHAPAKALKKAAPHR